jgi:lipoate-protein ligase A
MLLFDHSFETPEENLAADEALLEECEAGAIVGEVLRFWKSPEYFVVLGYTGKVWDEVCIETCSRKRIALLRRTSGGGTVLQGPGCLNYSLVLKINSSSLAGITETNRFVMERNARALSRLLGEEVTRQGHTDLTLDDLKFSGNAQRRRQKFLLFHGTFLLDFDLPLLAQVLKPPPKQPDYRAGRSHLDFLTNLEVPADSVKAALLEEWAAREVLSAPPENLRACMEKLIEEKYARDEWNRKF